MTLRTSIIGHNDYDKTGLLEWFLSQKKNIIGYKKAYFNGFSTLELSKIIIKQIILNNNFLIGIFHISSKKISKYDLLQKIKKLYNVKIAIKESNYFKIDRTLNSHKFKNIIQYKNPNWDQMLKEMKIFNERFKKRKAS